MGGGGWNNDVVRINCKNSNFCTQGGGNNIFVIETKSHITIGKIIKYRHIAIKLADSLLVFESSSFGSMAYWVKMTFQENGQRGECLMII